MDRINDRATKDLRKEGRKKYHQNLILPLFTKALKQICYPIIMNSADLAEDSYRKKNQVSNLKTFVVLKYFF